MLKLKLLSHTQDPEKVIAMAGKLCYSPSDINTLEEGLTPEGIEEFVTRLVNYGHLSPLEHVSFTFALEGVSRAETHQQVRHRIGSYSQQSQRYVNLKNNFEYVTPDIVFDMDQYCNCNANEYEFDQDMETIHQMYIKWQYRFENFIKDTKYPTNGMTPQKVANENARAVLPNACETKIIFTYNLRTIINFVRHRKCRRAQSEINQVAIQMEQIIKEQFPVLGRILGAPCEFGKCPEGAMTCGQPFTKKDLK